MAKEINLNVRIDDEMMAGLSRASRRLHVSVAEVVRLAVEDFLLRKQKRRSKAGNVSPELMKALSILHGRGN